MQATSSAVDPSLTAPIQRASATLQQLPDGRWVKIYSNGSVIDTHTANSSVPVAQPVARIRDGDLTQEMSTVGVSNNGNNYIIAPGNAGNVSSPPVVSISQPTSEPEPAVPIPSTTSQVEPPRTANIKAEATVPLESTAGFSSAGTNSTMYRSNQGTFAANDLVLGRAALDSDLDFSVKNAPGMTQNVDNIIRDDALQWTATKSVILQVSAIFTAWFLGHGGWSVLWMVVVAGLGYWAVHTNLAELAGVLRVDSTRAMRIAKADSEVESVEWINTLLDRYWQHYEPYLSNNLQTSLNATLATVRPPMVDRLQIVEFALGTSPPRIDAIKTFKRGVGDVVEYLMRLAYFPLSEEELAARKITNAKTRAMDAIRMEHAQHMSQATSVQELTQKLLIVDHAQNSEAAVESIPVTKRGIVSHLDEIGAQLKGGLSKLGHSFQPAVIDKPVEDQVAREALEITRLKKLLENDVLYDTPLILFKELDPVQEASIVDTTEMERMQRRKLRSETRKTNQDAVQDPRNARIVLEVVLRVGVKVTIPIAVTNLLIDGAMVVKMQFGGGFPHMKKLWLSLPVDGTTTQVILPALDFELKPLMAFDLLDVPGLSSWMMNMIRSQVASLFGPPGFMLDMSAMGSYPSLPNDAIGILHLKIVKSRGFMDTLMKNVAAMQQAERQAATPSQTFAHAFTKDGAEQNLETMRRGFNQTFHMNQNLSSGTNVLRLGCRVTLGGQSWPAQIVGQTKFVDATSEPEWNCDLKIIVPRSCLTEAQNNADVVTVWIFSRDSPTAVPVGKLEGLKILEWIGHQSNPDETRRERLVRLIRQRAWQDVWGPPDPAKSRGVWKRVHIWDPQSFAPQGTTVGSVLVRAEYWSLPTPQERAVAESELESRKHAARVKAYNEAMKETDVDPLTVAELAGELVEEATREAAGRGVPYSRQSGVLRVTIHQAKNLQDYSLLAMPAMNTDKANVVTKAFGGVLNVVGATANAVTSGLESLVLGSYSPYVAVRMRQVDPDDLSQTAFSQHQEWLQENGLADSVRDDPGMVRPTVPSPSVPPASVVSTSRPGSVSTGKTKRVLTLGRIKIPIGKATSTVSPPVAPSVVPSVGSNAAADGTLNGQVGQTVTGQYAENAVDEQQNHIYQASAKQTADPSLVYQTEPKFRAVNPTFEEYTDLYVSDLKSHEFEFVVKVMSESGVAERDLGRVWIRAWQAVERGSHVWFKLKGVKTGMICLSFAFTPVTMDVGRELVTWDNLSDAPDFAMHRVHGHLAALPS